MSFDVEVLKKSDCYFLVFFLLKVELCSCGCLLLGLLKEGYFLAFSRVQLPSLCWYFPPITLCRAASVKRYYVNLFFHGISCFLCLCNRIFLGIVAWADIYDLLGSE